MGTLVLQPTELAQWYALVAEAECVAKLELDQDIERYLVLMLIHYCTSTDIVGCRMSIDYLNALHSPRRFQLEALQRVADICLIYNGFYGEYLKKLGDNCHYYTNLGTHCYHMIFERFGAELYEKIADHYLDACHILQSVRSISHKNFI